jgi:hypothetical protein
LANLDEELLGDQVERLQVVTPPAALTRDGQRQLV